MRSVFRAASALAVAVPLLAAGAAIAGTPELYADLIATHAAQNGVPVQLAEAVVRHESNFNPRVTGRAGEIGLMQIKLETARGLGYRGSRKALYDPATNIAWGMKYLGQAARLAGGSECGTLSRYNAGLFTRRLVPSYCRQVAAKRYAAAHPRVREVRVATAAVRHGRLPHGRHTDMTLAYAGDPRLSRIQSTRNIFDDLFATNN
jgi:soluble lytic murein transglycosylase-like protein